MADQGTLSDWTFEIREAAYRIWESEGCPEGCEVDHWLRAEREVAMPGAEAAVDVEDISASVLKLTANVNAKRRAGS